MAMKRINLLPKELTISKSVQHVADKIKKVAYGSIAVFVSILLVGGGLYFYFNRNLQNLKEDQDRLKNNIQSLQKTEQQLIITKDRIAKVQTILGERDTENTFSKHKSIVDGLPSTISLESSSINRSDSSLVFEARDSQQLVTFMTSLLARSETLSVVLRSLNFNPLRGYTVDLEVF